MGVLRQLKLLLRLNLIERKRSLGLLCFEVIWPLVLFALIVSVRNITPAYDIDECNYEPRVLPSSGALPFMQNYVCNGLRARPRCLTDDGSNDLRPASARQFRSLVGHLGGVENVMLDNEERFSTAATKLSQNAIALAQVNVLLSEPAVQEVLLANLTVKGFFRDQAALAATLRDEYGLDPAIIDAVMNSDLNISRAKDLITQVQTVVCGNNGTDGSLSNYLILPQESNTSISDVNDALCNIDENRVGEFIDLLIDNIDTDSIYELASNLLKMVSPDAGQVISDVKDMIGVISGLESLQGEPGVQEILDIGLQALDLAKRFNDLVDFDKVIGVTNLINDLDPLITQWTGNSQEWQDFKKGVVYANKALGWMKNTLQRLPGMKVSFGNLYNGAGVTLLDHLTNTVDNSEQLANLLQQSTINIEKFLAFQTELSSTLNGGRVKRQISDQQETACRLFKAFLDIFEFPADLDPVETERIKNETAATACQTNITVLLSEFQQGFDVASLANELAGFDNSTAGNEPLTLDDLITTGWEIFKLVQQLQGYFEQFGGLFDRIINLDYQALFVNLQNALLGATQGSEGFASISSQILSIMNTVQSALEQTPFWAELRTSFIIQNLHAELGYVAMKVGVDVTNQTFSALTDPAMKQFVTELNGISSEVTGHVLEELSRIDNMKAILADFPGFMTDLCANAPGVLNLIKFNQATQIQVESLICGPDSEILLLGLSDSIREAGQDITNKIDTIVEAYASGLASLNSSEFDEYASLSRMVRYQLSSNELITQAIERFNFMEVEAQAPWVSVRNFTMYYIPYRIIAFTMEVVGPALEASEGWKDAAPWMATINAVIDFAANQMDRNLQVLSHDNIVGRTLDFVFTNGPDMVKSVMAAMQDTNRATVMWTVLNSQPVELICDEVTFAHVFPDMTHVDLSVLRGDICSTTVLSDFLAALMEINGQEQITREIAGFFNTTDPITIDWILMSKTMVDLPVRYMEGQQEMTALFMSYDWSKWATIFSVEDMMSSNSTMIQMHSMLTPKSISLMVANMLRSYDTTLGNLTEWKIAKNFIDVIDKFLVNQENMLQVFINNGVTLDAIFANSTEIRKLLSLQADLNPEMVDALFDTIVDPKKVLITLAEMNMTGRTFCNGISLVDFMHFPNETLARDIEQQLCQMDYMALLAELNSDKVQAQMSKDLMPIITALIDPNVPIPDVIIDYDAMAVNLENLIQAYIDVGNATMSGNINFFPDILPELISASNETAMRAQAAIEKLLSTDPRTVMESLDEANAVLLARAPGTLAAQMYTVWANIVMQLDQQYELLRMFMIQARAIYGKDVIRFSDFVLPDELSKLLAALEYSPELSDTVLYSLIELMKNPAKVVYVQYTPDILDQMCDNVTIYSMFFTLPPEVTLTVDDVQQAMCAFRPNLTLLADQILETWNATQLLRAYIPRFLSNCTEEITTTDEWGYNYTSSSCIYEVSPPDFSFIELYDTMIEYQGALAGWSSLNSSVTFEARFLNPNLWQGMDERFLMRLQELSNSTMGLSQADMIQMMLQQMLPQFDGMIMTAPHDVQVAIRLTYVFLNLSVHIMEESKMNDWRFAFKNTTGRLYDANLIFNNLPDYFEIMVLTGLDGQTIQPFIQTLSTPQANLTSLEVFCAMPNINSYFIKPAENTASVSDIQDLVCSLANDLVQLNFDIAEFLGEAFFDAFNEALFEPIAASNATGPLFENWSPATDLLASGQELYALFTEMIAYHQANPQAFAEDLQAQRWDRALRSVNNALTTISQTPMDANSLAGILESFNLQQMSPELGAVVNGFTEIAKVLIDKLQPANTTGVVELESFFMGNPETMKALQLLNISRDFVEIYLANTVNPKLAQLVNELMTDFQSSSDRDVQATICSKDFSSVYVLPHNSTADISGFQAAACAINWTVVAAEMQQDLEIADIVAAMTNTTRRVDWVDTISTMQELIELISSIDMLRPQFKTYPWTNEQEWLEMINRVNEFTLKEISDPRFQLQTQIVTQLSMAPLYDQWLATQPEVKAQLIFVQDLVVSIMDALESMEDIGFHVFDWLESKGNKTNLFMTLLKDMPDALDTILQTFLQPEPTAPLVRRLIDPSIDPINVICSMSAEELSTYFAQRNFTHYDIILELTCELARDAQSFNGELFDELGIKHIMETEPDIGNFTSSDFILAMADVGSRMFDLFEKLPQTLQNSRGYDDPWLNEARWAQPFINFFNSVQTMQFDPLSTLKYQQALGLNSTIPLPQLNLVNAIMDVLIEKLEVLNTTELNLDILLAESPETKKALETLVLPHLHDIVAVIMSQTSAVSQKMAPLFEMSAEEAFTSFCTSPADTYLSRVNNVNVSQLISLTCHLNFTAVANEVMSEVQIAHIRMEANNTAPVNLNEVIARSTRLQELITWIITNPPTFTLDHQYVWLNETVWLNMLASLNPQQQIDAADIVSQIMQFLVPMFQHNPDFNRAGITMNYLLAKLRSDLDALSGGIVGRNITIGDLFINDPELGRYVEEALNLSPDMYGLMMTINLKNPGEYQMLVTSLNPQELLCNETHGILRYVELPPEVNITAVEEFVCSTNFTVLVQQLMDKFAIGEILANLYTNGSQADWAQVEQDIKAIISTVQQLIDRNSGFVSPVDPEDFVKISQTIMEGIDWTNIETYIKMSESMMRWVRNQPFWESVKPYFLINQISTEWFADIASRLQVTDGRRINLGDLIENATILENYIQSTLALDTPVLTKLLSSSLDPSKITTILGLGSGDVVCDSTTLGTVLQFDNPADLAEVSEAVCALLANNATDFINQIMSAMNINTLMQEINSVLTASSDRAYSIRKNILLQLEMQQQFAGFVNVTEVMFNDVDLKAKFAELTNITNLMAFLQQVQLNLNANQIQQMGQGLDALMPLFKTTDWWIEMEPYFRLMNLMAEVGANRTSQLPAVNITLSSVIRDAPHFKKFLADTFAFTPDIVDTLIQAQVLLSPQVFMNVTDFDDIQAAFCTATFPVTLRDGNITAVREILCGSDFQQILDEMLIEFDLDILIAEFGMATAFSNTTSDFSWTELLTNTENLANNLGYFFTQVKLPPVNEFFMYEGNMTEWMDRLTAVFMRNSNINANMFAQLAQAMRSLEPLFSNTDDYRQAVSILQIVENYLELANTELERMQSGEPITLRQLLRNSTLLEELITAAFGAAPDIVELMMTETMAFNQLVMFFTDNTTDPCTADLSTLFTNSTPADVETLRNVFCSIDMAALSQEVQSNLIEYYSMPAHMVNPNMTSFNWNTFFFKFQQLFGNVEELIQNPPQFSSSLLSLVDTTEYMVMFDRVKNYWLSRSTQIDPKSFLSWMSQLEPLLEGSEFGRELKKWLSAQQVIIQALLGRLEDINANGLSLDTILGDAQSIKSYLQIAMNMTNEQLDVLLTQSMIRGEVILMLYAGQQAQLCSQSVDQLFILPANTTVDTEPFKQLVCQTDFAAIQTEFLEETGLGQAMQMLQSNSTTNLDWNAYFNTMTDFTNLLVQLSVNNPEVDRALRDAFNFTTRLGPLLDSLRSYDPMNLLNIFESISPIVEDLAGEQYWPTIQRSLYPTSFGLKLATQRMREFVAMGLTMDEILSNRTILRQIYSQILEDSISASVNLTFDEHRREITLLLTRPEIQELICDDSYLRTTLVPGLPNYVNFTSIMCGSVNNSWVKPFLDRGYSPYDLATLKQNIYAWYMDEVINGVYGYGYAFEFRNMDLNPMTTFSVADLGPQIKDLIEVLQSMEDLPQGMLNNLNISSYMPAIATILQAYAENMPELVLRQLELMEPLLRNTEFWKQLQVSLSTASQYMKWINNELERMAALGDNVRLVSLLPDISEVQQLLLDALSSDSAEEFLTLAFQPTQLLWALQSDPQAIFCNASVFHQVFVFPVGTEVDRLQTELCANSMGNSLIMQRVFKLFNMEQLISQFNGAPGTSQTETESPIRQYLTQFNRFLKNAELITKVMELFGTKLGDISGYIGAVTRTLSMALEPSAGNAGDLCDSVYGLIDEVPMVYNSTRYLVQSSVVQAIILDVVNAVSNGDEFICELPKLSMSSLFFELSNSELMMISDRLAKLQDPVYLANAPFQCSAMIDQSMTISAKFTKLFSNETAQNYTKCFGELLKANFTLLQDIEAIQDLIAGVSNLLDPNLLNGIEWIEPFRPILDELLKSLLGPRTGNVDFGDLFNITALNQTLRGSLGRDDPSIKNLLNSLININELNRIINKTTADLQTYICNSTDVNDLFMTPGLANATRVLCSNPNALSGFITGLTNNVDWNKLVLLSRTSNPGDFINEMVKAVQAIIEQLSKFGNLGEIFGSLDSSSDIFKLLPILEDLMGNAASLDSIFDNVKLIIDLIDGQLTGSAQQNEAVGVIFRDMKKILNGIQGLSTLRDIFMIEVPLQDLISDVDSFKRALMNMTSLSEPEIDQMLNSTFQANAMTAQFKTISDLQTDLCDPKRLPTLLKLPAGSSITYEFLSEYICTLPTETALNVSLLFLKNVNIGTMVQQLISSRLNIDTAEMMESFDALISPEAQIGEPLNDLRDALGFLSNTGSSRKRRSTSSIASVNVADITQSLCGEAIDIENEFAREAVALDNRPEPSNATDQAELDALPDQCSSIYKSIRSMSGGDILWSYIKPLLRGKILYTPVNDMTTTIIARANQTFQDVESLLGVVKSFVDSKKVLYEALNGTEGINRLQSALGSQLARDLFNIDASADGLTQQLELLTENEAMFNQLELVLEYADCVSLDRFVGVEDEAELDRMARVEHKNKQFMAAIVFLGTPARSKRDTHTTTELPKHIQYKIRMDIDNVVSTQTIKHMYVTRSPLDDNLEDMRYHRGFIQIQDMIDRSIIQLQGGNTSRLQNADVFLNQMPAPCHKSDIFVGYVYPYIIPVICSLAWMFTVAHAIKAITQYKEYGLEEMMKIMGLKRGLIFWTWVINNMFIMLLLSAIATLFFMLGRVLVLSNGFIVFLIFVCFSLSTLMFCYMVSAFFTKANTAAAVGVMLYLISYFPYVIYTQFRQSYVASHHHLQCLFSTTAFSISATYIARWEQIGEGIQWHNINAVAGYDEGKDLTLSMVIGWMLIDSVIYFVIGWYFRNIITGKFGVRHSWYFPFTAKYWGCRRGNKRANKSQTMASDPEYMDLPVGVTMKNLKKVYKNGKVAVNNLTAEFYEGHVTAFLGRNGAGKTTTINMLTGITSPSGGSACVNGYNIAGGEDEIRGALGYCAQYDMLFEFLTVKEHLEFYAALKGDDSGDGVEADVLDMLHNVGLWNARNELIGDLSGGMRRRLSVAIAFIGDPKVVILDEPTSSIDPNGRRAIWDIILKHRVGKTIILCTHHLDEADTLGDRIVIMKSGTACASGSPLELKKDHGSGYLLFLEKSHDGSNFDLEKLTSKITRIVPGAQVMQEMVGASLTFSLPRDQAASFSILFDKLDRKKESWGISGYGVSDATIDEVFQKVTGERADDTAIDVEPSTAKPSRVDQRSGFGKSSESNACVSLGALFRKRALHMLKDYKTYIIMLLLPLAFICLGLGVTKLVPNRSNQPSLQLQPALYQDSDAFYRMDVKTDETNALVQTMLTWPGIGTICLPGNNPVSGYPSVSYQCEAEARLTNYAGNQSLPECTCSDGYRYECSGEPPVLSSTKTNTSLILSEIEGFDVGKYLLHTEVDSDSSVQRSANRFGGWSFSEDNGTTVATVWFNNRGFHSAPAYMNSMNNMMLRAAVAGSESSEYGITVFNHPLSLSTFQLSTQNALEKTADLGISIVLLAAFSFIPAGLCVYLVLENVRGEKHLQHIYGVGRIGYWLTSYFWDIIVCIITIGITVLVVYLFDVPSLARGQNLLATFLVFLLYAWSVLPFLYMQTKLYKDTTSAFFTMLMTNLFLGVSLSLVIFLLQFFQHNGQSVTDTLNVLKRVFLISPQFCLTNAFITMSVNNVQHEIFSAYGDVGDAYSPFNMETGIVYNLIAMAIQGFVFIIITLLTEIKARQINEKNVPKVTEQDISEMDEDVLAEKRRVMQSGNQSGALVLAHLSKQYRMRNMKRVLAVHDLTFGVQPGQIFGLCGVNGAGKTTTFRMLTGEILASDGVSKLLGQDISEPTSLAKVGYCPQMNSLDSMLTGKQTLDVYAELRGITDNIDEVIEALSAALDMDSFISKKVASYSGGMRRKLCVAIALLGDPQLIMLDEPTAGMDPIARRIVWNQILAAARRGSAVLLTSHSMTECEALCDTIGIMLNGDLRCLGSSQHLKNKFGVGYTLKVKVQGPPHNLKKLISFVESNWPGSILKDCHMTTAEFAINQSQGSLGSIFNELEANRDEFCIEDYAVFQTTLDQVFIQFARAQLDQIETSEGSTDEEGSYSDSSHYKNKGYVAHDEIHLQEEKSKKSLQTLNGANTWSTHL